MTDKTAASGSAATAGADHKSDSRDSSLKGKRILVTGGAGYIGSHTVIELLAEGATVVIIDNLVNSSKQAVQRVGELAGVKPELHVVDLCDEAALEKVIAGSATFDACIHFAGLKAVGESTAIPLRYYDNNLTGTLNLLKSLQKHKCKRFVFSSSATVYGLTNNVPIKETEPLTATNAYGWTKLMIEQILRDVAQGKDGAEWRIAILRYFNPIGAHISGRIGENPRGVPNNVLPYLTQVAVGKLKQFSIFGKDYDTKDGTGVRDYIHVVDLAKGHLAALKRHVFGDSKRNCDEFNLGTGQGTSVLELMTAVSKASGVTPFPHQIVGRRAGDVARSYADCSKAEKELGWKAELSIERAVADSWRWQSQNPNGFVDEPSAPAAAAAGTDSSSSAKAAASS